MSQSWRGAPKPTGWEDYGYARVRVSEEHLEVLGFLADRTPCSLCEPDYVCAFHRDDDGPVSGNRKQAI